MTPIFDKGNAAGKREKMKVTIKYNAPIGDFKAVERTETFTATSFFESGNLFYFKLDRYNYKTVGKSDIVSIEK